MNGETLVYFQRGTKDICILLKKGENLCLENIVDVWICDQPERSKREDALATTSMEPSPRMFSEGMLESHSMPECWK